MNNPRRPRRGFLYVELLVVLMLLGVFSLIASQLFGSTMKLSADAAKSQGAANALGRVEQQLAADMWNAQAVEVPDTQTAIVRQPEDRSITWRFGQGQMTRSARQGSGPAEEYTWVGLPSALSFAREGRALRLDAGDHAASAAEIRFFSQLSIAAGGRP